MKPSLNTLSDAFMARVGIAAMRKDTAREMREAIEVRLDGTEGERLSPEKRADMRAVVEWLRKCE